MKIKFGFACVGSFLLVLEVELCGDWFGKQMIQHKVISQLDWMEFFFFSSSNASFTLSDFPHKLCNNLEIINRIKSRPCDGNGIEMDSLALAQWLNSSNESILNGPKSMTKSINSVTLKMIWCRKQKSLKSLRNSSRSSSRINRCTRWKWKERKATGKSIFIEFIEATG